MKCDIILIDDPTTYLVHRYLNHFLSGASQRLYNIWCCYHYIQQEDYELNTPFTSVLEFNVFIPAAYPLIYERWL